MGTLDGNNVSDCRKMHKKRVKHYCFLLMKLTFAENTEIPGTRRVCLEVSSPRRWRLISNSPTRNGLESSRSETNEVKIYTTNESCLYTEDKSAKYVKYSHFLRTFHSEY